MVTVSCNICGDGMRGSLEDWPYFPFCSKRCKLIDFGRWLKGSYTIPVEEPEDEDIDPEDTP